MSNPAGRQFLERPSAQALSLNPKLEHYVVKKSEAEGVADLRRLVEHQKKEEIWIFVKAKSVRGKIVELWYEIGIQENAESCRFMGAEIPKIVQDLKSQNLKLQTWTHYHFHPKGKNPYKSNIPSEKDYFTLDWLNGANRKLKWDLPQAGVKVVTGSGIWNFRLKKNHPLGTPSEEKFTDALLGARERLAILRMKGMSRCIEDPIHHCQPNYDQIGKKISTLWTEVEFSPFFSESPPLPPATTPTHRPRKITSETPPN